MTEPIFLSVEEVVEIHRAQIERFGGTRGVRDEHLLRSAVEMLRMGAGDERFPHDLFEMAAGYLFHMVMNHPFLDGTGRVGLDSALTFLGLNGYEVEMGGDAEYDLVMAVTEGRVSKMEVAEAFRGHALALGGRRASGTETR